MFDGLIFLPDPRTDQMDGTTTDGLIGVNADSEYDTIYIFLHSNDGMECDESHAALLKRNEKNYYQLLLFDTRKESFDDKKVFSNTYNVKSICAEIEDWFHSGLLQAHLVEEENDGKKEEYYVLISKKSSEN